MLGAIGRISLILFALFFLVAPLFKARRTGLAAIPAGEHFYRGQHCISRFHEPTCPLEGVCLRGDNCVWWGSGVFHWHAEPFYDYMNFYEVWADRDDRYHLKAHRYSLPNTTACTEADLPGYWFYGQWRADYEQTQCVYQRVPRSTVTGCLRGRKVLFIGDALVRQVMLRLIWYLRGFESIAEHYYHTQSTYSYYESEFDNFTAFDSMRAVLGPLSADDSGPLRRGESFRINFLWGDASDDVIMSYVRQYAPDVVLVGGFCSAVNETADGGPRAFIGEIVKLGQGTGKPSRVLVQPLYESIWSRDDAFRYAGSVRELVGALSVMYPLVNTQVLPVEKMAAANTPYMRNEVERNKTHFTCTYWPIYIPGTLANESVVWGMKTPADRDCRDLFNFEVVMLILNSLCL